MKRRVWLLLLALGAAVLASPARAEEEKAAEPFYRKYLVPGNRLDDQILEQQERVDTSPDDASLRNDFGNLLAARRFTDQAAEQYELAAKLDETNFIALYNLGLLRETEGNVSAAIKAYQKSIARKPGFPQSHFRLGRLYEKAERNDDAVAEYAKAMRIDRSMRDARRNPLVVDSELIYRASLVNYPRDVATASMARESVFVEESRFRSVPVDRPVSSQEAAEEMEDELEGRQISVSDAAGSGAATAPASAGPRRPGARPASQDPGGAPGLARPRTSQAPRRPTPIGGTPLVAVPPGSSVPPVPPPVEITPPPSEPEIPPESMPEPTPEAPVEEEPS